MSANESPPQIHPTALVVLAEGSEEMEFTIPVDILRRAGCNVTTAGIHPGTVKCSRGIRIQPDALIPDVLDAVYDIIVLPGGLPGADQLGRHQPLMDRVKLQSEQGGWVAAICAAPKVLKPLGLLDGKKFTLHPGSHADVEPLKPVDDRVVVDGRLITGIAAGASFEFALKIVECLIGPEKVNEINEGLRCPPSLLP